ncbi:MAG: hypothetical protein KBT57_04310 [bacterium]|nr:hypothetical protein [Candidatus Limimorpha equi]
MENKIIICLCVIALAGCVSNSSNSNSINSDVIDTVSVNKKTDCAKCSYKEPREEIVNFFGKTLIINNYANTIQQIETIAADDEMLRIEHLENNRDVLYIGEIGFGINIYKGELSLLSSTTAEDPKVQQQVVAYMNNLYGAPEECEPYNYLWRVSGEDGYFTIVSRLRCLHTEEGGTVLFFY